VRTRKKTSLVRSAHWHMAVWYASGSSGMASITRRAWSGSPVRTSLRATGPGSPTQDVRLPYAKSPAAAA
jgi:hypothetical protein